MHYSVNAIIAVKMHQLSYSRKGKTATGKAIHNFMTCFPPINHPGRRPMFIFAFITS
jgi:hypothetical protein